MMSSTRYLVEAGSTSPETRLTTINPSPSASRARRGRISCQTSGSTLKISVFFAGIADVECMKCMIGVNRLGFARGVIGFGTREFRKVWGERHPDLAPTVLNAEQSNTSIVFGDRFILKMYRRIEPGIHPEIEIGTFLTERYFPHAAPLTGTI